MRAIRAGRRIGPAVLLAVTAMAVGCSRGPDATALRTEVQGKLDQRFKPGLFGLDRFRRQGSAPLPASDAGAKRLAVYFNATLKLNQGYDFGDLEGLSPATLAHILGATENTVKKHLQNMFEKLGVDNRNAAGLRALEVLSDAGAAR